MTTSAFIHRATVQRNSETGSDAHGNPLVPVWAFHMTLDCAVYNNRKILITDGDKTASITTLRIAYRLNEDITVADQITAVKDRNNGSLYSQTYAIKQPVRRRDHWEADLIEVE